MQEAATGMADATNKSKQHPEAGQQMDVLVVDTPTRPPIDLGASLACLALPAVLEQPHGLHRTYSSSSGSFRLPPPRSLTSSSLSSSNSTSRGAADNFGTLPPHQSPHPSAQPSLPSCYAPPSSASTTHEACPPQHLHQQAGQAPLRPYNWPPEKRARSVFFARVPPSVGEEELAALFGSVGRVEEVQLFKAFPRCRLSKGCGVVVFTTPAEADTARTRLHGYCYWASSRHTLVVDPVKAADQVQPSTPPPAAGGAEDAPPGRGAAARQLAAVACGGAAAAAGSPGRAGITGSGGAGRQATAAARGARGPSARWLYHKLHQRQDSLRPLGTGYHHQPGLQQVLGVGQGGLPVVASVAPGGACFLPPAASAAAAAAAAGSGAGGNGGLASMVHLLPPLPAQQQQQLGRPGGVPLMAPPLAAGLSPCSPSLQGAGAPAGGRTCMYAPGPDGALQLVQAGTTLLPAAAGGVAVYGAGGAALHVAGQGQQQAPPAAVGGAQGGVLDTSCNLAAYAPPVALGSLQGVGLGQQARLHAQEGWAGPQASCLAAFSDLQQAAAAVQSTSQPPLPALLANPWQQQAWQQQQQVAAAQQQQVALPQPQPQLMVVPLDVTAAACGIHMPAVPLYQQQLQQHQVVAGMHGAVPLLAQQAPGFTGVGSSVGLPDPQHVHLVGGQPGMVAGAGTTGVGGQLVFVPGMPLQP